MLADKCMISTTHPYRNTIKKRRNVPSPLLGDEWVVRLSPPHNNKPISTHPLASSSMRVPAQDSRRAQDFVAARSTDKRELDTPSRSRVPEGRLGSERSPPRRASDTSRACHPAKSTQTTSAPSPVVRTTSPGVDCRPANGSLSAGNIR
eukprot:1068808-Pyramimonas_sp.AAC.1